MWWLFSLDPSAASAIGSYIKMLVQKGGEIEHYRDRAGEAKPKLESVTDKNPKNMAKHRQRRLSA